MRIAERERNRRARAHVLWELRVIRRRKREPVAQAPAARRHAERSFSGDVNAIGSELAQQVRQPTVRQPRQPDFRIRRTRKGAELVRLDDRDFMAAGAQRLRRRAQRLHDAIGLRPPGVRNDRNLHAACSSEHGASAPLCEITSLLSVQRSRLRRPFEVFGERGAALDPVAVVAVKHAVDLRDLGAMDVAADGAVQPATPRFVRERALEVRDVFHRVLHLVLEVRRERPVREAERAAEEVHVAIELQHRRVRAIAQRFEQRARLDDAVELVAVQDQQATAIGGLVNRLAQDLDVAEHHAVVVAEQVVVIARDVDDARAVLGLAEDRADDVVVGLRPEERLAQAPHVDDVADEVERFGLDRAQEVQQVSGAAAAEAQVDVRDEHGPKPVSRLGWHRAHGRADSLVAMTRM